MSFTGRLATLGVCAAVALVALETRLVDLATRDAWADVGSDNALRTVRLDAPRGRIIDRTGHTLAAARPARLVATLENESQLVELATTRGGDVCLARTVRLTSSHNAMEMQLYLAVHNTPNTLGQAPRLVVFLPDAFDLIQLLAGRHRKG